MTEIPEAAAGKGTDAQRQIVSVRDDVLEAIGAERQRIFYLLTRAQ